MSGVRIPSKMPSGKMTMVALLPFVAITLLSSGSFAQDITIKDGDLQERYFISRTDQSTFRLTYKVNHKDKKLIHYRSIDFNQSLAVIDTVSLFLKGDYSFVASAESANSVGILMGSAYGELMLYATDKVSRQITPFRIKIATPWKKTKRVWLLADPDLEGFLVFYEAYFNNTWEILAYSKQGQLLWSKKFEQANFAVLDAIILGDRIFIACGLNVGTKKERGLFRVLEYRDGSPVLDLELDDTENKRVIDNIVPYSDQEVLLTGRTFFRKVMSQSPVELPLIWRLNLETGKKDQIFFKTDSLVNKKIFWIDLVWKNGVPCLIGEGATPGGDAAAGLAFGIASVLVTGGRAAIVPTTSNLKLNEVVVLPIKNDRPIAQSIPVAAKSITSSGDRPALQFVRWAYKTGKTHLLSTNPDGNFFVSNGEQVVSIDPLQGFQVVGKHSMGDDVIFTTSEFIIQLRRVSMSTLYIWIQYFQ
jgi:hypothetical protein